MTIFAINKDKFSNLSSPSISGRGASLLYAMTSVTGRKIHAFIADFRGFDLPSGVSANTEPFIAL